MVNADYTIFVDQCAIFICKPQIKRGNVNSVFIENEAAMFHFLDTYLPEKQTIDVLLFGYDAHKMFCDFKNHFRFIEAAGGVVKNQHNEFLFIKRFGIWDLPKGKVEGREKLQECAVREVEEETGIRDPVIKESLPFTYHIYQNKGDYFLKKTHWYLMEISGQQNLSPQTQEDITEVAWLNVQQSQEALTQSYRSLNDSLSRYITE